MSQIFHNFLLLNGSNLKILHLIWSTSVSLKYQVKSIRVFNFCEFHQVQIAFLVQINIFISPFSNFLVIEKTVSFSTSFKFLS